MVILITSLLYPDQFWHLPILGGSVSIIGTLLKRRILISSGIAFIGTVFFLSNLGLVLSFSNIFLLITVLIVLYGFIVYLNNLIKRDIIWKNNQGDIGDTFHHYRKNWNRSVIKNLSLAFLLALIAFMISWIGSFDFWIGMENIILLGVSSVLTFALLALLYILFIKLPSLHKSEE